MPSWRRIPGVAWRRLGTSVLLARMADATDESRSTLTGLAAMVWTCLDTPADAAAITDQLAQAGIDADTAAVNNQLAALHQAGWVVQR